MRDYVTENMYRDEMQFFSKNDTGEIVWTIKRQTGHDLLPFQVEMLNDLLSHHTVISCRGAGRSMIVNGIARYYAEVEHDPMLEKFIKRKLDRNDYTKYPDDIYNWRRVAESGLMDQDWFIHQQRRIPHETWLREYECRYQPMSEEEVEQLEHEDDTFILVKQHQTGGYVDLNQLFGTSVFREIRQGEYVAI